MKNKTILQKKTQFSTDTQHLSQNNLISINTLWYVIRNSLKIPPSEKKEEKFRQILSKEHNTNYYIIWDYEVSIDVER